MKLINLNIWGGKIYEPLMDFIEKNRDTTDIFCFQEIFKSDKDRITNGVHANNLGEISKILSDFNFYFSSTNSGFDIEGPVNFPLSFGQANFIKKGIAVKNESNVFVYRKENDMGPTFGNGRPNFPRNFIYSEIDVNGKSFLVLNIHGYWEPAPKYDTPQRFEQTKIILEFIKKYDIPIILAGDLNLGLNTQSLLMIEEKLQNLVKKYELKTTRSNVYPEEYKDFDKFADYIFVSDGVVVNDFRVLTDEVSDHLPLYLEFEV